MPGHITYSKSEAIVADLRQKFQVNQADKDGAKKFLTENAAKAQALILALQNAWKTQIAVKSVSSIGFQSCVKLAFTQNEAAKVALLEPDSLKIIFYLSALSETDKTNLPEAFKAAIFIEGNSFTGLGVKLKLDGSEVTFKNNAQGKTANSLLSYITLNVPTLLHEVQVNGYNSKDVLDPETSKAGKQFYSDLDTAAEGVVAITHNSTPSEEFLTEKYDPKKWTEYVERFRELGKMYGNYSINDGWSGSCKWNLAQALKEDTAIIYSTNFAHFTLDPKHLASVLSDSTDYGPNKVAFYELLQKISQDVNSKDGEYFFNRLKLLEFETDKEINILKIADDKKTAYEAYFTKYSKNNRVQPATIAVEAQRAINYLLYFFHDQAVTVTSKDVGIEVDLNGAQVSAADLLKLGLTAESLSITGEVSKFTIPANKIDAFNQAAKTRVEELDAQNEKLTNTINVALGLKEEGPKTNITSRFDLVGKASLRRGQVEQSHYDFNHFISFSNLEDAKIFRDFLTYNKITSEKGLPKSIQINFNYGSVLGTIYLDARDSYLNHHHQPMDFDLDQVERYSANFILSQEQFEAYQKVSQNFADFYKTAKSRTTTPTTTTTTTTTTATPAASRAPAVNPRAYEIALAPGETRAQAEFRNALACIAQANPYQRAILRDRLATASCPPDILRDLQMGLVQLDTTDFLNFLLDEVMPDVNKVDVVSTVTSLDGDTEHSAKSEKQTKLELNFPGTGNGNASITTMLQNYQAGEFLDGANKYKHNGSLVDAIKKLTPKVTNSDAELVVSIKRFDYRYDGTTKQIVRKKIETPITLDQVALPCGDEQKQYLPTAFIVHLGSTMRGGHYVAYVKEQKDDGSQVWVEYNDSARTELTADLPEEAQDAYVVKYSPVNERGVCKLPKSQSHGTSNGGNRCWANAAFAFAMSMVSLDKREVAVGNAAAAAPAHYYMPPQDQPRAVPTALSSGSGSDNDFVDAFLALEEESSNSKSPGDHLAFLKRVATLFARKEKDELSNLGEQIAEMGFRSPDVLLGEAVGSYFTAIATDNNTESLTDLHGFFSDPANSKLVSGIIGEIVKNEDEFKKDPEQFVAEKITSETPLTRPASQRRGAKTIIELCCDAAEKGDVATFERYLERIKTNPKFEITLRELILPVANDLPEEKRDEKQRIVALINSLLPEKQQRGNQSTPPEEIPDSDDEEGENLQALLASMAAEAEAERKRKEAEALLQLQRQKDGAEALARAQAAALAAEAERIKEERVAALAAEAAKREKEAEEEAKRDWTILEGNQYKLKLETPTSTSPLEPTAILLAKESKFMSVKTVESTAFKDSLRGSSMRLAQGATTDKNELIKLLAAVVISSIRETLLVKNYDSQDILIEDRIQAAMDYAKSNGGFSSKVKDKKDKGKTEYADIEETTAPRFFLEFWKEVSGKIQQKNLELGILTGRLDEDKPNDDFVVIPVGLRSTFVFDILSSPEALAVLNGTTGIAVGTASRTMAELLSKSSASGAEVDGIKQMISTAKSAVKTANNPDTGASR